MRVALVVLCACIAFYLLFSIMQNYFFYHCGSTPNHLPPSVYGLPAPAHISDSLRAFMRSHTDIVVYYFHGNGVSVENDYWRIGQLFAVCNCSIYVLEYAHCLQATNPYWQQHEILLHLSTALTVSLHRAKRNYVLAASMGTAYFLHALLGIHQLIPVEGIIVENPFTSIPDVVAPFPAFLIRDHWHNDRLITKIPSDIPVLFLTSERDEIVPPTMSFKLRDMNQSPLWRVKVLSGALHGHAASHPEYLPAVVEFISQ